MRIAQARVKLNRRTGRLLKRFWWPLLLLLFSSIWAEPARLQTPNYVGFFELADCTEIAGWAADRNRLNTSINVSIFDGQTLLTTVLANLPRPDVGTGLGDNGLHGFFFPVPNSLKDGQPHSINVRFESTNVQTTNSPRTITCGTPVTPRDNVGTGELLDVDFRLNNGADSTTRRLVNIQFSATEVVGAGRHNATSSVTHYRILEEPDGRDLVHDLSTQSWLPIDRLASGIELALRNASGERYGERRVAFQVKTATLTSKVVSDTITLAPLLKEYTVPASADGSQPLIQYAASQGFEFGNSFCHQCEANSGASCERNISTGHVSVTCGTSRASAAEEQCLSTVKAGENPAVKCGLISHVRCDTQVEYQLFFGRELNQFWRIKTVNLTGATLHIHGVNRFLAKFTCEQSSIPCSVCPLGTGLTSTGICSVLSGSQQINIGAVTVEGPEVDDFVDTGNPWKNAFVRPERRLIPPTVLRPD